MQVLKVPNNNKLKGIEDCNAGNQNRRCNIRKKELNSIKQT